MDILREVSLPALNNVEDATPELLGFIFFSRMETLTDSEVVSSTAQIIDIRLHVKALDYSQYTPICQNVPAPLSWRLVSADKVFIVLVPSRLHPSEPLYEPPDVVSTPKNIDAPGPYEQLRRSGPSMLPNNSRSVISSKRR
ncbi:hypothetical protein M514_10252 [Trichuris suis]|uniref:Uncharacterized protein n=1 Tax=Trichuris suis TaxID=68888 RepID=A0A085N9R4_9BILA|nr:hypothetical protein M514_10252 [Trichuris suis]